MMLERVRELNFLCLYICLNRKWNGKVLPQEKQRANNFVPFMFSVKDPKNNQWGCKENEFLS